MREIRSYGLEGGGTETNQSFLPLLSAQAEGLGIVVAEVDPSPKGAALF
jgi:hypothetical protein